MQLTAMFHSIFSHDLSRLIISRDSMCLAKNEDTSDGWKSFDAAFLDFSLPLGLVGIISC